MDRVRKNLYTRESHDAGQIKALMSLGLDEDEFIFALGQPSPTIAIIYIYINAASYCILA